MVVIFVLIIQLVQQLVVKLFQEEEVVNFQLFEEAIQLFREATQLFREVTQLFMVEDLNFLSLKELASIKLGNLNYYFHYCYVFFIFFVNVLLSNEHIVHYMVMKFLNYLKVTIIEQALIK